MPAPRVVLPPRGRPWSGKSVAGTRRAWRAVTLSCVCWGLCLGKAWTMQKAACSGAACCTSQGEGWAWCSATASGGPACSSSLGGSCGGDGTSSGCCSERRRTGAPLSGAGNACTRVGGGHRRPLAAEAAASSSCRRRATAPTTSSSASTSGSELGCAAVSRSSASAEGRPGRRSGGRGPRDWSRRLAGCRRRHHCSSLGPLAGASGCVPPRQRRGSGWRTARGGARHRALGPPVGATGAAPPACGDGRPQGKHLPQPRGALPARPRGRATALRAATPGRRDTACADLTQVVGGGEQQRWLRLQCFILARALVLALNRVDWCDRGGCPPPPPYNRIEPPGSSE